MPTIFTVGVGGTHSTVQAAFDAIPSVLADQYIIRLKKQEFVAIAPNSVLTVTARTTTPTFNIIIEAEPGASWKDDPNVRINPLRYDAAKGAAMRSGDAPVIKFTGTVNHLTIRNLQIKQQATALASFDMIECVQPEAATNRVFQDLIVEQQGSDNNDCFFLLGQNKVINCIVIHGGNNPDSAIKLSDFVGGISALVIGCTVVRPSHLTPVGKGLHNKFQDNSFIAKNNVSMNFAQDGVNLTAGSDYNATNFSSGASGILTGSHNVYSVPYDVTTFEQPSNASGLEDFRPKRGSLLENAGVFDGVNSPNDASGLARGNPPEIGAWEIEPLNPIAIDDRTTALPNIGQTKKGVQINPVVIGDDFRVKRTYTALPPNVVITTAWLTVKESPRMPDAQALIKKQITVIQSSQGQLSDANTTDGQIAMYFDLFSAETALAKPNTQYFYDIKVQTTAILKYTLELGFISFTKGVKD